MTFVFFNVVKEMMNNNFSSERIFIYNSERIISERQFVNKYRDKVIDK